jgi:hypothetical protein
VTDAEVLRIWNTLPNQTYTEARVFSCAVSAHENNGEIDRQRAVAVLQAVWPQNTELGAVPSEIRGNTANLNNNRNRQADFDRLTQRIRGQPTAAGRAVELVRSAAEGAPMDDEQFGATADYLRAFEAVQGEGIADNHSALLRAHLAAPGYATTWGKLAEAVGYPNGNSVNLQYGSFAERVARQLGLSEKPRDPGGGEWWLWTLVRWADAPML